MPTPDFLPTDINPDLHVVISKIGENLYICPTRKVSRRYLVGLVQDALSALANANCSHVDPSFSPLNLFITVAEINEQLDSDDFDEFGEDDEDEGTPIESR